MINETHEATAIVLESGSVFKVKYLSRAEPNVFGPAIDVSGQYKILCSKDALDESSVTEGSLIKVIFGSRIDKRLGKLSGVILGFRKAG